MKWTNKLQLTLTSVFLLACGASFAQDTTQDEADVWAVVEEAWNADENGDREWPAEFLVDDFSGWSNSTPVPRGKSSAVMWDRFGEQLGKIVAHELYPYNIVVHGDMAVAHYLYSSAFKPKDGDIKMNSGRYTDVLVRTDDGWKFLAWHGGDDED